MVRGSLLKKAIQGFLLLTVFTVLIGCSKQTTATTQTKSGSPLTTPNTPTNIDDDDNSSISDNILSTALSSPALTGWKSIYSLSSNTKCLATSGTEVTTRDCTENTATDLLGYWYFDPSTFEVKIKTSTGFNCLTSTGVAGDSPTVASCNGSFLQKWTYVTDNYSIQNLSSGFCLVYGSDPILEDTCDSDVNAQKWGLDYQTATTQWSYLKSSPLSTQCFAVNDSGSPAWSDGAAVVSKVCSSIPASQLNSLWNVYRIGLNTVSIQTQTQNGKGLQCLTLSSSNSTQVVVQPCTYADSQVWVLGDHQSLKNKVSGQCLSISSTSPAQLVTQTCDTSSSNQHWNLVNLTAPPTWTLLQSAASTSTCGVVQNGKGAGSAIASQNCDLTGKVVLSKRFLWFLDPATYEIKTDTETGAGIQCLDVQGQSTAANALAIINPCTGSTSQKWTYTSDQQLKNENSGLCLSTDGTSLRQYYCSGSSTYFKWNFTSIPQNGNWWSLKKVSDPTQCYTPVKLSSTNYVINPVTCTQSPGANQWIGGIGLWSYDLNSKQLKTTALDSNGTQCLAFQGTSRDVGAKISASSCTGGSDQQWEFTPDLQIRNTSTGLCLYHSSGYFYQDYCTKTSTQGQWVLN